jgi:nucleotide-binding universal stress UspA family protein
MREGEREMFQRILVPLDGSSRAEHAIPVAALIAHASGGSLVLLRVVPPLIEDEIQRSQRGFPEESLQVRIAEATSYLTRVVQFDQDDELEGIETSIEVLSGEIAPTLLSHTQSSGTDLIVMCSRGETGLKRWMLGSVATKVARHTPVPVLILCEHEPVPPLPQPGLLITVRALVALDGSAFSEAILKPAAHLVAALATPAQGALHLLRVVDVSATNGLGNSQAYNESARQNAQEYLASVVERLQNGCAARLRLAITSSVVAERDVAGAIITAGKRLGENGGSERIIAMSTHGRGGLQRWAVGSVTERVLHKTTLPLFIMRPQEMETKGEEPGETTKDKVTEVEIQTWTGLL